MMCYDDRVALRDSIGRKAGKEYETDGRPMGLLVYIDGVFHPPRMPPQWAQRILDEEGPKQRWVGIWLYDSIYGRIVACWRKTGLTLKTPKNNELYTPKKEKSRATLRH